MRRPKVAEPISEAAEIEELLCRRFPLAFRKPARWPLAIGIYQQILAAVGGDIDATSLSRFMATWVII
jgi:sRNA-binding protein